VICPYFINKYAIGFLSIKSSCYLWTPANNPCFMRTECPFGTPMRHSSADRPLRHN